MSIMQKIRKNRIGFMMITLSLLCALLAFLIMRKSFAVVLDNDVEVAENSELTYYLNVSYDGVDKNGVSSTTTTVSDINSGYLYVEDKLPEGLIFSGFVTTEDGSIGAVKRGSADSCPGSVVDDTKEESTDTGVWNDDYTEYTYHGLHYDATTRTVRFAVKNLQAGCELTVGIRTTTPTIDDPNTPEKEVRRDFYNFATASEEGLVVQSNTVHTFMGSEFETMYSVSYEYAGSVPENAPTLPIPMTYSAGTSVGVAANASLEGYTFSGWTTDDVLITDGSFQMPEHEVVFQGSFTPVETYSVRYEIEGVTPPGYVLPTEKEYYAGTVVSLDSLQAGNVFNDYRFLGWSSSDVTIDSSSEFEMPEQDVVITGRFEEVTYRVSYQFYDTVLPPNAEDYLPETKSYRPGETVHVEDVLGEPSGYVFLGWYKESEFEMPEQDVVIYGEWKVQPGTFEPEITKQVVSTKDYYHYGDEVQFAITVTNLESFAIQNVIVRDDIASFEAGSNYTVLSDHVIQIDEIPAGESFEVYATYSVAKEDTGTIVNTAQILGATAENGYELYEKEYQATASFEIQSKITICKEVSGVSVPNTFQFAVTGVDNDFATWVTISKDECETIYVDPAAYRIREIVPQEYEILNVSGAITSNASVLEVVSGQDYQITYTNSFKKKGFYHSFGRVVNQILGVSFR